MSEAVTFDVVNHIFVVVCGCGPMINLSRSLAIFCLVGLPITSLVLSVGVVP